MQQQRPNTAKNKEIKLKKKFLMEYLSLGENVSSHLGLLVNESVSHSVLSDFLRPHGLWPTRLLCLWNSPGKNIAVGHHSLLQGIFLTCEAVIKPILL